MRPTLLVRAIDQDQVLLTLRAGQVGVGHPPLQSHIALRHVEGTKPSRRALSVHVVIRLSARPWGYKDTLDLHLESLSIICCSAAQLQEHAYAASTRQGGALGCESNPNTFQLEHLARLPTSHSTHSGPVCNILQTVRMR